MNRSWIRTPFVASAICLLLMLTIQAPAQILGGGPHGSYTLTITVDGVNASTTGKISGTAATLTPDQDVLVNYYLKCNSTCGGAPPEIICQLETSQVYNQQESTGGGGFYFTAPSSAGIYWFSCSINGASGGTTPLVNLPVS